MQLRELRGLALLTINVKIKMAYVIFINLPSTAFEPSIFYNPGASLPHPWRGHIQLKMTQSTRHLVPAVASVKMLPRRLCALRPLWSTAQIKHLHRRCEDHTGICDVQSAFCSHAACSSRRTRQWPTCWRYNGHWPCRALRKILHFRREGTFLLLEHLHMSHGFWPPSVWILAKACTCKSVCPYNSSNLSSFLLVQTIQIASSVEVIHKIDNVKNITRDQDGNALVNPLTNSSRIWGSATCLPVCLWCNVSQ